MKTQREVQLDTFIADKSINESDAIEKSLDEDKTEKLNSEQTTTDFSTIKWITSDLMWQCFYELIGMFFFVNMIILTHGAVEKFALGLWVLIVIFSKLSGSHFNPAVTFACYLHDQQFRKGLPKLLFYILAQFIGAVLGVLVAKLFTDFNYIGENTTRRLIGVIYSEFLFTGTFIFVILWMTSSHTAPTPYFPINTIVIIAWFYVVVQAGSALSGASYNPMVLFVINFIAFVVKDSKALNYLGWMMISEFAGAAVFSVAFTYLFEAYLKKRRPLV
jgi:glycerol uptake facilitator-like aquaporin